MYYIKIYYMIIHDITLYYIILQDVTLYYIIKYITAYYIILCYILKHSVTLKYITPDPDLLKANLQPLVLCIQELQFFPGFGELCQVLPGRRRRCRCLGRKAL